MPLPINNPRYEEARDYILRRLSNELSSSLKYHGLHHTFDVMDAAMEIAQAEGVSGKDLELLKTAIVYHDSGFIYVYKGHEARGAEMASEILPQFDFSQEEIDTICGMIMATHVPQSPTTLLEKIICDADLDYLGRGDAHDIAHTLLEELLINRQNIDPSLWGQVQIDFLEKHHYHTNFSKTEREPLKQQYLDLLKNGNLPNSSI
jgi:uncharacterized protein